MAGAPARPGARRSGLLLPAVIVSAPSLAETARAARGDSGVSVPDPLSVTPVDLGVPDGVVVRSATAAGSWVQTLQTEATSISMASTWLTVIGGTSGQCSSGRSVPIWTGIDTMTSVGRGSVAGVGATSTSGAPGPL